MELENRPKELRRLLISLVRNLSLLDKSEASCCNITLAQCHAIVEIGVQREIYLNGLAEALHLDKSTMSRTINNLVEQNLVERDIDPENRKYITIKLSEKGQKTFEDIQTSMEAYYYLVLQSIPKEKQEQVLESLQILVNAVQKYKCC